MGDNHWRHHQIVQEAADWISRIEAGEARARRAFTDWLAKDAAHRRVVRELICISTGLRSLTKPKWDRALRSGRERAARASLDACLGNGRLTEALRTYRWHARNLKLLAASVLICALAALPWQQGARSEVYTTGLTEWRPIQLADGSVVKLNCHSTLRVQYTPEAREVELIDGEAFFIVAPDIRRPFKVEASGIAAIALGTQFDVRLEGGGDVMVIVKQGRVRVGSHRSTTTKFAGTELHRGQSAYLHLDGNRDMLRLSQLSESELHTVLAWGDWLMFQGGTLREAADRFNSASGTSRIVINDPDTARIRIGGAFRESDIAGFAQVLTKVLHLEVSGPDTSGTYHVSRPSGSQHRSAPSSKQGNSVP
jgi:transmembrane sensor